MKSCLTRWLFDRYSKHFPSGVRNCKGNAWSGTLHAYIAGNSLFREFTTNSDGKCRASCGGFSSEVKEAISCQKNVNCNRDQNSFYSEIKKKAWKDEAEKNYSHLSLHMHWLTDWHDSPLSRKSKKFVLPMSFSGRNYLNEFDLEGEIKTDISFNVTKFTLERYMNNVNSSCCICILYYVASIHLQLFSYFHYHNHQMQFDTGKKAEHISSFCFIA